MQNGAWREAHNGGVAETLSAKVLSTLEKLVPEAKTLLLAVSGGGDSVALLRLLAGSSYHLHVTLHIAHFDHALRPESVDDAAFVRELAEGFGLPCHGTRAEVARVAEQRGWNLEDAARRLRYDFLTRTARQVGADAVVTAHTRDDQAETVLLQLLRGAAFLSGIPPRRGRVVRPLLGVSRSDLQDFLRELGQPCRDDPTNADTRRARAWLRHEVLLLLRGRYPNLADNLAGLAELQQGQRDALQGQAETFLSGKTLDLVRLRRQPPAVQRTALAELLRRAGVAPDRGHLEALRAQLERTGPTQISLPGDKTAILAYGSLSVVDATLQPDGPSVVRAETFPGELEPAALLPFGPLYYRRRAPGDRIRLAGGSKGVSDLLIDRKVPRASRDALTVLATQPVGPSDVLWIEGVAADIRVAKQMADPDVAPMREALRYAQAAADAGEVPVGAVVVYEGKLIAGAANETVLRNDPTAHAELLAMRAAAGVLGDWRLAGCTLYVTLEPCPMCFGGLLAAHLPRLVCGARNTREGALGGVADLREHTWKRGLEVRSGVLARDAERLLQAFFAARRTSTPP